MKKNIKIPITFGQPTVTVSINGENYVLETGKDIEVESFIADFFERTEESQKPDMEPVNTPFDSCGGSCGSGGGAAPDNVVTKPEIFEYSTIPNFTNVLLEVGLVGGKRLKLDTMTEEDTTLPLATTGYIPVSPGSIIRVNEDFAIIKGGYAGVITYDANKTAVTSYSASSIGVNPYFFDVLETDANGNILSFRVNNPQRVAYIRICNDTLNFGEYPVLTVNEEITYTEGYTNKLNPEVKVDYSQIENAPAREFLNASLPVLYLEGDTTAMSKDAKVTLNYKFNDRNGSCTCKWQGSSSLSYEKKNYTIEFDTPFEAVAGWGVESKYCMKANYIDFSHIRNICAAKLWGEARKASNLDTFSSLINSGAIDGFPVAIVINDEYKGLYSFTIPKDGWMFGFVGNSNTEAIISAENGCDATMFKTPPVIDGNDFEFEYMDDNADETALRASFTELYNQVANYTGADDMYTSTLANVLDMDRLLDYYVFVVMLDAVDCYKKNYLMATKDGVKWHLGAYDLDTTWGNHWHGSSYYKPTWRNFEWYASQSALFNIIYTHHRGELKARFNLRKADKWSEENVFITLYNYAVQIPKIYFDEEVKLWKDLPGTYTNDIAEILNFHRMKLNHLTKEVNGWQT